MGFISGSSTSLWKTRKGTLTAGSTFEAISVVARSLKVHLTVYNEANDRYKTYIFTVRRQGAAGVRDKVSSRSGSFKMILDGTRSADRLGVEITNNETYTMTFDLKYLIQ